MKKQTNLQTKFPEAFQGHVSQAKYFFFENAIKPTHNLAIVFGGREQCAPDFQIKRSSYPYYIIEIPIKGKCQLKIAAKDHTLKKGTIAGFAPRSPHHYICDPKSPMEHYFIAFRGKEAKSLFKMSTLASKGAIEIPNLTETTYLAEAIFKKGMENSKHSQQICANYLRILLLEITGIIAESTDSSLSLVTYKACKKYIDENFSLLRYPRQVANEFAITTRHMSRLFRQYNQTTPHEYIMRLKMNKATVLLMTSNMTVKRIATLVGFHDQYHFSRNFKNLLGHSPKNYRNIHT